MLVCHTFHSPAWKAMNCRRFLTILLLLLGASASADIRQIALPTRDLVYDRFRRRVYASVPSTGGRLGNSITAIDPLTGEIGPPIFVGSEPGRLALSADGRYLYVALDGAAAVRRVDLAAQTADLQFSLGGDDFGPYYVGDMEVSPDDPQAVAISLFNKGLGPGHAGVAVYDNGVPRPRVTPRSMISDMIEFSATASRLYGFNRETSEHGFRRMAIDPSVW
jgi:hypothetical protein